MIYPKRLQSYRTIPSLWWTTLVSLSLARPFAALASAFGPPFLPPLANGRWARQRNGLIHDSRSHNIQSSEHRARESKPESTSE